MASDYHKLNQLMALIAAAVPEEVSLFDKINISSPWYASIDMENVFFLIPINKYHKKLFNLSYLGLKLHLYYPTSVVYQLFSTIS